MSVTFIGLRNPVAEFAATAEDYGGGFPVATLKRCRKYLRGD